VASAIKLVLDCPDPPALAPFWAAALGYVVVASLDQYLRGEGAEPGPIRRRCRPARPKTTLSARA
jgi:hypothetical protein